MSARDGYQPGVPCWVAAVLPDAAAGVAFSTGLYGWEAADIMPPDGPGSSPTPRAPASPSASPPVPG